MIDKTATYYRSEQSSYEYDMKISPADDMLYISVPQKYQVWRVESQEQDRVGYPKLNKEVVAGNGLRCIPGAEDRCGDDGLATKARLNFPKGQYIIFTLALILFNCINTSYIDFFKDIKFINAISF